MGVQEGRGEKAQTRQTFPNFAVPLFATTRNVTSVVKSRTAQICTQYNTQTHTHTHTNTRTRTRPHTCVTHAHGTKEAQGGCIQHPQSSILGLCQKEYMTCYINIILVKIHPYYLVFILHWNV